MPQWADDELNATLWLMQLSLLIRPLLATVAFGVAASVAAAVERPVSAVSWDATLSDAHQVAKRHNDLQVLRIAGSSMLPFFGEGSVVIVKRIDSLQLRAGMVVVYQNRFGETVAHRLIAPGAQGWKAQGYNNREADSTPVTDANLVGVVYATFHSAGLPAALGPVAALSTGTPVALAAPAR